MVSQQKAQRKTGPNKSAFIRQHPDLAPAALVAKGKEAGLDFSAAFVSAIRSKDWAAKRPARTTSRSRPGRRATNGKTSASDFIRAQPIDMKARDVIDAATKAGLKKFGTNLVYLVRSKMGTAGVSPKRAGRVTSSMGGDVAAFKRMALDLGIPKARQALDELERGLAALLR